MYNVSQEKGIVQMVLPIFLSYGKRVESFGASYEVTPIRVSISWIKRMKRVKKWFSFLPHGLFLSV
jgi:hypothetical protein